MDGKLDLEHVQSNGGGKKEDYMVGELDIRG